jgi:nicotinamidase-related amidase
MSTGKTALLVIDVQRGILALPNLLRKKEIDQALDQTVGRIAGLIDKARQASVPVIYVQHDGGSGHRLEPQTPGWAIRPEIQPHAGDLVIHKRACDAFFETTLDAELRAKHVEQLVICGCMTQYCIDTSVRRAVSLGYDVVLAGDAHTTTDTAALPFEQIVAHHNGLLDGFDAGEHEVHVCPCAEIRLARNPGA